MVCPYCGKEMKSGTLYASRATGIAWLPDGVKPPRYVWSYDFPEQRGGLWLCEQYPKGVFDTTDCSLKAELCENCNKGIISLIPGTFNGPQGTQ